MTRTSGIGMPARGRLRPTLLGCAIAAVLPGAGVVAQETETPTGSTFEEVIVTAQRREQSIYDVPVALSAFTPETIERQGIQDLTDIGKFVPNLNVTEFSAGHTSSANPFIRGIGLQDHLITTEPGVGVYVDGVYLGRQVGQNWSLANIERVEVLRGPQGTLYGRNSIGGAINIITRKPGDEGGKVSLMAGSRERLNVDAYVNKRVSDEFAISITGAYHQRDGLGDFLNVPNASKRVGELQDISARIALQWNASDQLSFLVTADGNKGDNGLRPYDTLIDEIPGGLMFQAGYRNADGAADPYDNNTGQVNQVNVTNKAYGVSLTVGYAVSDALNFKLLASDRHSEYESGLDDDGFFDDFMSFPEVGFADQQSVEFQVTGQSGAFDYVVGLFYYEEEGQNFQDGTSFACGTEAAPCPTPGGSGDFFLHQKYDSQAIYANVGFHVTDAFRIAAGVRQTEDDKSAETEPIVGVIGASNSNDGSETTWDLSASYKFADRMTLYGAVQSGYQAGQYPARAFCLFGDPNCFAATDNVTAINYEVGVKGEPFNNLQLSLAVFNTDYTDLPYQVSSTAGAGFNTVNIVVDQTSRGAELEGTWVVTDNFRVHGTLGYIDVDVDDPNPVVVAPLTPEITASLSPELSLPLGGGQLTTRVDWSFRDDMFGEPSNDPGRFTFIESRDLINFDITYEPDQGDWSVGLYGRNVTDERYDNARLNPGYGVLVMLSNDASEFGLRFAKEF